MAKPTKRKVQGGRTTPKGGPTPKGGLAGRTSSTAKVAKGTSTPTSASTESSGRYTAPTPHYVKESPPWVPIVMFALLGIGTLLILLNYTGILWDTSNWYLMAGLGAILAGIITATQYR